MNGLASRGVVLLAGAGFTKNFGGFLADEMWTHVFNNPLVGALEPLRRLLLETSDFESAYSTVAGSSNYSPQVQQAMVQAVEAAYRLLDDATRGWVFRTDCPYPVNWYQLSQVIELFSGRGQAKGFFFTLNQDLFIERSPSDRCPGAPRFPAELYHGQGQELQATDFVTLPQDNVATSAEDDIRNNSGLVYIKLHGSYGLSFSGRCSGAAAKRSSSSAAGSGIGTSIRFCSRGSRSMG